ncbi:hypothetical protein [Tatumella punctata]|uniref:Uncharacterized protein n=1 Tax=Tatumella punctata TaxID=399969 RepID=A0ABW1VUB3_9GAMM
MVKLKDIVNNPHSSHLSSANTIPIISTGIVTRMAETSVAVLGISKNKQAKFADQANSLVTDDKFLDELQYQIGEPTDGESEDEFVAKAKSKMRELLFSKLK